MQVPSYARFPAPFQIAKVPLLVWMACDNWSQFK